MYDFVLKGGTVVDGTRGKPYVANVAVKDGKIAAVTTDDIGDAGHIIDVSGKIVSPGFIDIHSHSERGGAYLDYSPLNKILQGITTEAGGNCGGSPCPYPERHLEELKKRLGCAQRSISEYRDYTYEHGHVTNLAMFTGHSPVRVCVVDYSARVPSKEEMKQMEQVLEHEMQEGSLGLSLGLIYPPSAFGKTEEIVNLAKVVKKYNGVLSVHMRSESTHVFEAVEEMLEVAEKSGVRLQISHLKLQGPAQWGKTDKLFALIESAQKRGVDVRADQYPYVATSTSLSAVVPNRMHEGGVKALIENLNNATKADKQEIEAKISERGGAETVLINTSEGHPEYRARRLADIAKEYGITPVDAAIKIITDTNNVANCSYFCMSEQDVLTIMKKMYIAVGTDGWVVSYDKDSGIIPHPRNFNTYPRFFEYVREKALMPIEDAVYKCTALPADILHLKGRGMIKAGYIADITVFDKDKIKDPSDYIESRVKPVGIDYVIVNGKIAVKDNELLDGRAGTFVCPGK